MAYRVQPWRQEPTLLQRPTPPWPPEHQELLHQQQQLIQQSPHLYNGACLAVLKASLTHIHTFACDFAHSSAAILALQQARAAGLPAHPDCGQGSCNVALLLQHREQWLWQLRSPHTFYDPNCWQLGAGGIIDPGEQPRQAVLREAQEELGIQEQWLRELQLIGLGQGDGFGACLIYRARLPRELPREHLHAHPDEAQQLRWGRLAAPDPQPLGLGTLQHLQLLQQLGDTGT